ncbi:MAG: DUF488 domain-containing protein [Alistipes sp.]|nr:DUF488 domain-containing protein [Alistipes sp.]
MSLIFGMDATIYSIGHGNKPIGEFLEELAAFGIAYLVDVRSRPYSKWNPDFNQEPLRRALKEHGIVYGFMGDALGGVPADRTFYDAQGRIVYETLKQSAVFLEGLERIRKAEEQRCKTVLMCSETDPAQCHRSKLIGAALLDRYHLSVCHIVARSKCKTQEEVMAEVTGGASAVDLFGNPVMLTSKKAY